MPDMPQPVAPEATREQWVTVVVTTLGFRSQGGQGGSTGQHAGGVTTTVASGVSLGMGV